MARDTGTTRMSWQSSEAPRAAGGWQPVPAATSTPAGPLVARPSWTPTTVFGLLLVAAGFAGLVLGATLPWLIAEGDPGAGAETFDRREAEAILAPGFLDAGFDYGASLIDWTTLAFVLLLLLGAAIVVVEMLLLPPAARAILRGALLVAACVVSLLLLLASVRLLGWYLGNVYSGAAPLTHLHVAPYLNLVAGVALLARSALLLRSWEGRPGEPQPDAADSARAGSIARAATWVAVATLLLLPLVPFAVLDGGTYLGEYDLELVREFSFGGVGNEDLADAADQLGTARLMVWTVLWLSLATSFFASAARGGRAAPLWTALSQGWALAAIPILVGFVFAILGTIDLFGVDTASPGFNYFLPLAFAGLGALWFGFASRVSRPFLRQARAAASGSAALLQCPRCTAQVAAPRQRPATVACPSCGFSGTVSA